MYYVSYFIVWVASHQLFSGLITVVLFLILWIIYKTNKSEKCIKRYCSTCKEKKCHSDTGKVFDENRYNGGYPLQCDSCGNGAQ